MRLGSRYPGALHWPHLDNFKADTPEKSEPMLMARQYADSFEEQAKRGHGLIFSSKPGTGKSHLATAILQAIMPQHIGLYITCMSLIRQVRATWRRDSEQSEGEVLQMLGDVSLLVLDEVGVQYGTDGNKPSCSTFWTAATVTCSQPSS